MFLIADEQGLFRCENTFEKGGTNQTLESTVCALLHTMNILLDVSNFVCYEFTHSKVL